MGWQDQAPPCWASPQGTQAGWGVCARVGTPLLGDQAGHGGGMGTGWHPVPPCCVMSLVASSIEGLSGWLGMAGVLWGSQQYLLPGAFLGSP